MSTGIHPVCCTVMEQHREHYCRTCDEQGQQCPDAVITRFTDGTTGIPVHDGGSSIIEIAFCPWCGTHLFGDQTGPRRIEP